MFLQKSDVSAIANLQSIKVVAENQYNYSEFAKKILSENKTSSFVLQKSLYCIAKQPLLPCKTGSFTMPNNTYCKVLVMRMLYGGACSVA